MLVKDYMTRHPILIGPETPAAEAQKIMAENNIRHLPVVGDGKRLLGLITSDRLSVPPTDLGSLNVWEISRLLWELKVSKLMIKGKDLITIDTDATIEHAALLMIERKIGCLPVVEQKNIVVGIISEVDLLVELSVLLGGGQDGVRVTVRVPDRIGEFAKVTSAISNSGWGIYSSGSVPSPKREGYWDLVVKVRNVSPEDLAEVLKRNPEHEIVDIRMTD